jgi:hypothetical protein
MEAGEAGAPLPGVVRHGFFFISEKKNAFSLLCHPCLS